MWLSGPIYDKISLGMRAKVVLKSFWESTPFRGYFYLSSAINLFSALAIFLTRNLLPPVVPLLYGHPEGAEQLVPKLGLLVAPAVAMIITIINLLLTRLIKNEFLQKILVLSAFLISVLAAITILKIIFLVGSF